MTGRTFKFPSIELYNNKFIKNAGIYEKIDGANVSFRKNEKGILVPWSRGSQIGNKQGYYFEEFRKRFYSSNLPNLLQEMPEELILFGEFTHIGNGHINYNPKNANKIFPFGFYNFDENRFLKPQENEEWFELLEIKEEFKQGKIIKRVPKLYEGPITKNSIKNLTKTNSKLYNGVKEGVVIYDFGENQNNDVKMYKAYSGDFSEIDTKLKGIEKYLNLRRFIKAGQKAGEKGIEVNLDNIIKTAKYDVIKEANLTAQQKKELNNVILRMNVMNRANSALKLFH